MKCFDCSKTKAGRGVALALPGRDCCFACYKARVKKQEANTKMAQRLLESGS